MAGAPDTWTAAVRYLHSPHAGLVPLGKFAVPREARIQFTGDDTLPGGRRWPDATFRFEVRDGAAVCTEVHIVSKPGDRGIHTNDLVVFNLDALAEEVFTALAMKPKGQPGAWTRTAGEPMQEPWVEVHQAVEASHALDPLAELLDVARIYLTASLRAVGSRAKPTESVMEVLGYGSKATTSRKVKAARDAGWIPAPSASNEELATALHRVTATLDARDAATSKARARREAESAALVDPEGAMRTKADAWSRRQARRKLGERDL